MLVISNSVISRNILCIIEYIVHNLSVSVNPLNAELNPIYHLLALLGAHHILHVSRIRVEMA